MYNIRLASNGDAKHLPEIERSAGTLFNQIPELAWIADDEVQSEEQHLAFIAQGTAWVAVDADDKPVGFINGEKIGSCFHIWEMSVHSAHQRNGLGFKLIDAAKNYAIERGSQAITLTTFRDVPWNAAFYKLVGFDIVANLENSPALVAILEKEVASGLPTEKRCAMRMELE